MTAYLMSTATLQGKKVFSRAGAVYDLMSYKHVDRVIEQADGNRLTVSLAVVTFEEIADGSILEIDSKIYRVVSSTVNFSGSCNYYLEHIRK